MKVDTAIAGVRNEAPRARAVRALRSWITEGMLLAGDVLPAERDISLRLGVGLGTVQRALRMMEDEGLITKSGGRTRIVAAPTQRPASVLSDSVLVIADAVDMRSDLAMYGWGGYVGAGVLHGLGEGRLHSMLVSPQRLDEETLRRLLESKPRGLVIPEIDVPDANPLRWLEIAAESRTTTVVFGEEAGSAGFDRVVPDHESGCYQLTHWLLKQGRRSIRQYWTHPRPENWALARRAGYQRAMREAGLEPLEPVVSVRAAYSDLDEAAQFAATVQSAAGAMIPFVLGGRRTDAIMVDTDGDVPMIAAAIRTLSKVPNRDIALVGYDDYWDQSTFVAYDPTPPLASVNKNNFECGRALSRLLHERLDGKLPPEPQVRLIKPTLSVRDPESIRSAV